MPGNILSENIVCVDPEEFRILLDERIGRFGQFEILSGNHFKKYLPMAGPTCRIVLEYNEKSLVSVEPGPSFDAGEWENIQRETAESILVGPKKFGRDYSFSSFRVNGYWRGERSEVQILPAPPDAPNANKERAEHPFLLELPIKASTIWPITNHRRIRDHRKLTQVLDILLAGRTSLMPRQSGRFWALVQHAPPEIRWVTQRFFGPLDPIVCEVLSPPNCDPLEIVDATQYLDIGHDGRPLRVPSDLDSLICAYFGLSPDKRDTLDRAMHWFDLASRQWDFSVSASFTSLVTAVEAFTVRGETHAVRCDVCNTNFSHEVPGATERFRAFFERYAPGQAMRARRTKMYEMRSGIVHGSSLMDLDYLSAFGWEPPGWNQRELHGELWKLIRVSVRNWLMDPM